MNFLLDGTWTQNDRQKEQQKRVSDRGDAVVSLFSHSKDKQSQCSVGAVWFLDGFFVSRRAAKRKKLPGNRSEQATSNLRSVTYSIS